MKRLAKLEELIPKYAWLPIIAALIINYLAYFASRAITTSRKHYYLETPIDSLIPVVPAFVAIYIGAYLFWGVGYYAIARGGQKLCLEIFSADILAKLICLVIFLVFPTTAMRPEVTGTDVFSEILKALYAVDPADNYFPSIHCLESWACFRGVAMRRDCRAGFKAGCFLAAAAVFLSTVFLKQHMVPDILGGVLVFEVGLLLSRQLRAPRLLEMMNRRFSTINRERRRRYAGKRTGEKGFRKI